MSQGRAHVPALFSRLLKIAGAATRGRPYDVIKPVF